MVICKFFLQGNCRFGENCKFEHQINDGRQHQQQQHSSVLRQQNFTANTNVSGNTNSNIDQNTLIRAVINDTLAAEKGEQWLLSCYAPFKEKPNFPGFEEQSFEEIRWGYYEAQHLGTVNQFKQQFQISLQEAILKLRALQNPSQEAINTIKNIYNSSPGTSGNVFANSSVPSNFNNPPTNAFGNNQNAFNNPNTNNMFGQTGAGGFGNPNVFGQSNNQQQNSTAKSIFSTATQKLFGGPQQQNSIFANNQMAGNGNFGRSAPFSQPFVSQNQGFTGMQQNQQTFVQQQPGPAGFGAQQTGTSPFGSQPQTGTTPFGVQQQSGASPFHQQQTSNLAFSATQQNPSLFSIQSLLGSQQNTTSPFAPQQSGLPLNTNQQQNETPFGVQQHQGATPFVAHEAATPFSNPTNIFGGNLQPAQAQPTLPTSSSAHTNSIYASSNAGVSTGTANVDESVYSKLEELSESDIKSYESENFEFGKIPEKPPTIQMCL